MLYVAAYAVGVVMMTAVIWQFTAGQDAPGIYARRVFLTVALSLMWPSTLLIGALYQVPAVRQVINAWLCR